MRVRSTPETGRHDWQGSELGLEWSGDWRAGVPRSRAHGHRAAAGGLRPARRPPATPAGRAPGDDGHQPGLRPGRYPGRVHLPRSRPAPSIYWSGAPQGTKSLALVVDDADAPITPYIYWIVLDISPATTDIQAGLLPPGARQADNSRGFPGYDAPCPIHGSHKYRFTIYALSSAYVMSSALRLGNGASAKAAWTAIARSAIARGRLTATANGLVNN